MMFAVIPVVGKGIKDQDTTNWKFVRAIGITALGGEMAKENNRINPGATVQCHLDQRRTGKRHSYGNWISVSEGGR